MSLVDSFHTITPATLVAEAMEMSGIGLDTGLMTTGVGLVDPRDGETG